jgi:hypothetical protein
MKKIIVIFLFCGFLSSSELFAEDNASQGETSLRRLAITAYPGPVFGGWYSLECELALGKHVSLALETKYYHHTSEDGDNISHTYNYFMAGPGLRFYPSRALNGFFIGAYSNYVYMKKTGNDSEAIYSYHGYTAAVWFGNRWVSDLMTAEISVGYGYSNNEHYMFFDNRHFGFMGLGLGVGIAI